MNLLKQYRERAGFSQARLVEEVNALAGLKYTIQTISMLENNNQKTMPFALLWAICEVMNCAPQDIGAVPSSAAFVPSVADALNAWEAYIALYKREHVRVHADEPPPAPVEAPPVDAQPTDALSEIPSIDLLEYLKGRR